MHSAILQSINGVSFAALLFLLASGFTLSFGLMRVVNMAHGAYYLFGGYVGLSIARTTGYQNSCKICQSGRWSLQPRPMAVW